MTVYHKEKTSYDDKSNGDLVTTNVEVVDKVDSGIDKNSIKIKNEVKLEDNSSLRTGEKLGNDSLILRDKKRKEGSVNKESKDGILSTSRPIIAYAISLTQCDEKTSILADGAAVLKHSIHLSSYPHIPTSSYAYQMYAFVHPTVPVACTKPFEKLNYTIQWRETPINVEDIRGDFLRSKVNKTGCCGEKEFLKLYAYTLVDHPIVVHLDLDSIVLQPLDDLFNVMLGGEGGGGDTVSSSVPIMFDKSLPPKVDAFYTKDYNMVHVGKKLVGVQGGFLVIKPNMDYFNEYIDIILEGNFRAGAGWQGRNNPKDHYGGYFGAQQIQGICSLFFGDIHPNEAVELNRCYYNSMADSPYDEVKGKQACRDGHETCEDCRETNVADVKSAHFTLCQKPWICPDGVFHLKLCKELHRRWFDIRVDLEKSIGTFGTYHESGKHYEDVFQGFCKGRGQRNYIRIKI